MEKTIEIFCQEAKTHDIKLSGLAEAVRALKSGHRMSKDALKACDFMSTHPLTKIGDGGSAVDYGVLTRNADKINKLMS